MKPGELCKVKTRFHSREKPHISIEKGEILMFLRKEIEIINIVKDTNRRIRTYFFIYKDRIISFSLRFDPVKYWVQKYT